MKNITDDEYERFLNNQYQTRYFIALGTVVDIMRLVSENDTDSIAPRVSKMWQDIEATGGLQIEDMKKLRGEK